MQKELRLSGSGGQGVITAAIIFAEAAAACGMNVAQSQSYGPEARGGASRSEVIVSDDVIYHPHVEHPDIVLAMTQAAADKYAGDREHGGHDAGQYRHRLRHRLLLARFRLYGL